MASVAGAGGAGAGMQVDDRVSRLVATPERAEAPPPSTLGTAAADAPRVPHLPGAGEAGAPHDADERMPPAAPQAPKQRRVMTGARTTKPWCVSAQPQAKRRAHCQRCFAGFEGGEWRVGPMTARQVDSTAHRGQKWFHLTCVDAHLGPASALVGYASLSEAERQDLALAMTKCKGPILPVLAPAPLQVPVLPQRGASSGSQSAAGEAPAAGAAAAVAGAQASSAYHAAEPAERHAGSTTSDIGGRDEPRDADVFVEALDESGDEEDGVYDDYLDDDLSAGDPSDIVIFANLDWWDTVPWDRILLLGAPTTAMIPDSMSVAVGNVRVRVCAAIERAHQGWLGMHVSTPERLWKVFLALDGLLFSEGGQSLAVTRRERIQERLGWILTGQWDVAWMSMEEQVRTAPLIRGREDKIGDRIRRVSELVQAGELTRAAAAVWSHGDMADATAVVNKFQRTQALKPDGDAYMAQAAHGGLDVGGGTGVSPGAPPTSPTGRAELRSAIANHLRTQFGRFPRRGGAGPGGGRYEHWAPLRHDPEGAQAVAATLARLAVGDLPQGAQDALMAARLAGIPKTGSTDIRILGCGGVARRMVGRSAAKVYHAQMREAAGDQQFGLARDGCGALHRRLCTVANARPGVWILAVDLSDAFSSLSRDRIKQAVRDKVPELSALAEAWLPTSTQHVAGGGSGRTCLVEQRYGVDQGCPMSPGFFALGTADDLQLGRAAVRRRDAAGDCGAFLDDTYFMGQAHGVFPGFEAWKQSIESKGLSVNMRKTQLWSPDPNASLPDEFAHYAKYKVSTLKAVGSTMAYVAEHALDEDWRDVPLTDFSDTEILVGAHPPSVAPAAAAGAGGTGVAPGAPAPLACGQAFLDKQKRYFDELLVLHRHGLPAFEAFQLARTWAGGACVHLQRALPLPEAWAERVDDGVVEFVCALLQVSAVPRAQLFMKVAEGGFGFGSAVARGPGALLAAWEGGIRTTALELGETNIVGVWRRWPGLCKAIRAAEAAQGRLAGGHGPPSDRWQGLLEGRAGATQKTYTSKIKSHLAKEFMTSLGAINAAAVHGASGPSAGAWLDVFEGVSSLADQAFRVAAKRRMHLPLLPTPSCCQNRPLAPTRLQARTGNRCGKRVDVHGTHAFRCPRGGGLIRRHDAVRDAVAEWLRGQGFHALTEQVVPGWDDASGAAVLDVIYHSGTRGRICLDVSLVDMVTVAARRIPYRPALQRREQKKHRRYPHAGMVAFVLDARGRWGVEAETWLRQVLSERPESERQNARRGLRAAVAYALQSQAAEQIALAVEFS